MSLFYRCVRWVIRLLAKVLFRLEAVNLDNVPPKGGYLLVANHASNLDPPLIAVSLPRACHTLAKRELFDVPLLGWAIKHLYAHPIDRGGVDRKALRECIETLRRDELLLLFPEGTRTSDGSLQSARAGAAMIAYQAGVPVIPVYVDGTFKALRRGAKFPKLRKVRVVFGEAFVPPPVDGAKREQYDAFAALMMEKIASLRNRYVTGAGSNRNNDY